MRIGMILDKTFPPDPRVENEAITLIESGHEVYLFCLTYFDETPEETLNGIRTRRYKSNKITYKLSALAYELPFYSQILKPKIQDFILKNKIEVLHIHDMRIAGSVYSSNQKFQLPVVLDLHDNYPEVMKEYPHLKKLPGKFIINPKNWLKKEQEFIEKATKVITVSPEFQKIIQNRLKTEQNKVILVPNTVRKSFYKDATIQKPILERFKNDFVLLYIGDTGLRRGLMTAIEAIPILKKRIPNVRLVIVGTSSADAILHKQVIKLQIETHVSFEGWQDEKLFPSYIKCASVGISPLIRSKQHDVAYANKLFQYMSFGLPVLVSDAIAQKNLITHANTGLVHFENNPDDFAEKIQLLHTDNELYSNFGKNAIHFIENKFHWERTVNQLVTMYKNIYAEIT